MEFSINGGVEPTLQQLLWSRESFTRGFRVLPLVCQSSHLSSLCPGEESLIVILRSLLSLQLVHPFLLAVVAQKHAGTRDDASLLSPCG